MKQSAYRGLALEEIDGDPFNVRSQLSNIAPLADSIAQHGMLENLVVIELPEPRTLRWLSMETEDSGPITRTVRYEISAGSRRHAALELLVQQGRRDPREPVQCLIIDTDGIWENLVENVQRVEVRPWDIGRRLNEFAAAGHSNREIARHVGHSNGWVNRYQQIGRGLAPETVDYIEQHSLFPEKVKIGLLYQLSFIVDSDSQPDGKAQVAALTRRKTRAPRLRRGNDTYRALSNRMHYLETQMPVPPMLQSVVSALVAYLRGGGRPNLRKLEGELLESKRRFDETFARE